MFVPQTYGAAYISYIRHFKQGMLDSDALLIDYSKHGEWFAGSKGWLGRNFLLS